MRGRLTITLLLLLPLVSAAPDDVQAATFDLFHDVDLATLSADTTCGSLANGTAQDGFITIDGDQFEFTEGVRDTETDPMTRTACAAARFTMDVPAGTEHMHLRFDADRRIDEQVVIVTTAFQRVVITDHAGRVIRDVEYFGQREDSHDRTRHTALGPDGDLIPLPEGTSRITIAWVFQDYGRGLRQPTDVQLLASGQDFRATVWDPWVEFSGRPVPVTDVTHEEDRAGSHVDRQHRVHLDVAPDLLAAYAPNLRIQVDRNWTLVDVITPQGNVRNFGGYEPSEEYTSLSSEIKVEPTSRYLQVVVPGQIVQDHGGGEYVLVFSDNEVLPAQPSLVGLNVLLALLPLLFIAIAVRRIAIFQREAFGMYRKSATNLLVALALLGGYYVVVMTGAVVAGWFAAASTTPLGADAFLLYAQMLLALGGAVFVHRAGRNLYRIVQPAA